MCLHFATSLLRNESVFIQYLWHHVHEPSVVSIGTYSTSTTEKKEETACQALAATSSNPGWLQAVQEVIEELFIVRFLKNSNINNGAAADQAELIFLALYTTKPNIVPGSSARAVQKHAILKAHRP